MGIRVLIPGTKRIITLDLIRDLGLSIQDWMKITADEKIVHVRTFLEEMKKPKIEVGFIDDDLFVCETMGF